MLLFFLHGSSKLLVFGWFQTRNIHISSLSEDIIIHLFDNLEFGWGSTWCLPIYFHPKKNMDLNRYDCQVRWVPSIHWEASTWLAKLMPSSLYFVVFRRGIIKKRYGQVNLIQYHCIAIYSSEWCWSVSEAKISKPRPPSKGFPPAVSFPEMYIRIIIGKCVGCNPWLIVTICGFWSVASTSRKHIEWWAQTTNTWRL